MKKDLVDLATSRLKQTFMSSNQNQEKTRHAETIVRNHVLWSMGASFIPIPIADFFAVSALQLDMIRQLCRVYEIDFSETQGKAIISSLVSTMMGRGLAKSFIKLIPGIGTLIGGVTVSIFNGASTYALGQVFKTHFEFGGTFLDLDTERLKKMYREQFEKGKKVAEQMKKEYDEQRGQQQQQQATPPSEEPKPTAPASGVVDRIKEIAELRNQGLISEEEFEQMKKRIIDQF
jgi:uncharacterized protein (DUF697 family)